MAMRGASGAQRAGAGPPHDALPSLEQPSGDGARGWRSPHDALPSLEQPSGDGARRWRCGRGQTFYARGTTPFLPWSSKAGMARGDGDAGRVGPSMRGASGAQGAGDCRQNRAPKWVCTSTLSSYRVVEIYVYTRYMHVRCYGINMIKYII
jgi:hypothetical protein